MQRIHIVGQHPLSGSITISGRKNAALKLIAASVLSTSPVRIENVPNIGDVGVMLEILKAMGAKVTVQGNTVDIHCATIQPHIPNELGRKLRASLVLVGPLLARCSEVHFPHPGGCVIGKRSILPHMEALEQLGASCVLEDETYHMQSNGLIGASLYMTEKSVTGTENVLMAATMAQGTTVIHNAAEESHIQNLCQFLRSLGYQVSGDGTSTITIVGQPLSSQSASITVIPDEIEVGTYAVAAAVTQGSISMTNVGTRPQLFPILHKLNEFGVQFDYNEPEQLLHIHESPHLVSATIQTNPWPGFPPDLQSPFTVLATQATGVSLIHDWMYEGRLAFCELLQKMGANIVLCDPHRALVSGPTQLTHNSLITPDLRAGAALVVAALAAEGESIIEHAELIDRGYEAIDIKLQQLGATIYRSEV
jgi:UDP-N-acetylglucosamine 1-carboxyvinyltransferase